MNPPTLTKNTLSNSLWLEAGKRRWLKRFLEPFMPAIGQFKIEDGFNLFLNLKDWRGPSFYVMFGGAKAFGHYELEEKREILQYLPDDGVFLDLGANIGLFSFYIHRKKPKVKIGAFEPHPVLYRCFELTQTENQINSVKGFNLGISDAPETLELFLDETDSGGHSLRLDSFSDQKKRPRSVHVKVCTLDQIAEQERYDRVDFIKIDVQDLEDKALKGAKVLIQKFRPNFLIEFRNALLQSEFLHSQNFPLKNDYKWKPIGLDHPFYEIDQLKHYSKEQLEQGKIHSNYLFIRKSDLK
jgi:FkbM family methyltransferase